MSSELEHLRALETAYWNDIVAYFEAMPRSTRPSAYKKYSGIREIIALLQPEPTPATLPPTPHSSTGLPRPRSLTDDMTKQAIHDSLAAYFVRRQNKAALVRDALATLTEQHVHVPGKSPASTLAALISRDSTGRYAKVGDGYWHLSDMYYQKRTHQYQNLQEQIGKPRGLALV